LRPGLSGPPPPATAADLREQSRIGAGNPCEATELSRWSRPPSTPGCGGELITLKLLYLNLTTGKLRHLDLTSGKLLGQRMPVSTRTTA